MSLYRSIDIVIPSYRLDISFLDPLISMDQPAGWTIRFFLIADNPDVKIPAVIAAWQQEGRIRLIVNPENLGPGGTRNIGIHAGSAKWILFLDDDVLPMPGLLEAYTRAIDQYPDAIGFVGVTEFPEPINATTHALIINGSIGHFDLAKYKPSMVWSPTANVMLNRSKMDPALFDVSLQKSGEDIDFMVRSSFLYNEEYRSVPEAIVKHPWWNNGKVQTGRLFRYGGGGSEIARLPHIYRYTYLDFANSMEIWALLLILLPLGITFGFVHSLFAIGTSVIVAEVFTNLIRAWVKARVFSVAIAFQLTWIRTVYEAGYLYAALSANTWKGIMRRADLGFVKPNPSPFRLNRYKILKMIFMGVLLTLYYVFFA
ncbi:glycosyltransferase [Terrimonas sp. NA20]|uniref:Glycosyltransferase n=1 Tax=Terrimonas ginsenosidimutans TaxID=2908004 RepID=A0ABS9L0A0_9BACT|nr:glycosyltransferase [Terrimonas ginsenosidimutans]MCG2618004.1 glycosyltransferase [Terrimonas ginsenosidimutans]